MIKKTFISFATFLLLFTLAISFTEEAAGSQNLFSNMQFSDIEPSGACTIDQTPQYIIDTDNECTCSNNTWSCSLSKNGVQSIATTFTLINDNAVYKAIDSSGKTVFTSTDPGMVLQSAIDAIFSTGGKIVLRNGDTFTYQSTIPSIKPEASHWISIVGYGATIKLSSSANRAFDFEKQGDFDVFSLVHLEGFTVDARLLKTYKANHILLGFYNNDYRMRDVSVDGLVVKNIDVLNVFADAKGPDHAFSLGLSPMCTRGAIQEPFLKNIWVSGMKVEGGEAGIAVTVSEMGTSGAYNCFIENVFIRNNSVSLGLSGGQAPPAEFYAGTGIFVGGDVRFTRNIHISDNYVQHAGDNCYEVSAPIRGVTFHNNSCVNPFHVGLTLNNFPSAGDPNGDNFFGEENLSEFEITVSDFSVRYTTYPKGVKSLHRGISLNNSANYKSPFGSLKVSNMSYVDVSGDKTSSAIYAVNKWKSISIDNMQIAISGIEYDEEATPSTPAHVYFKNTRADGFLQLHNIKSYFDGDFDAATEAAGFNVYTRLFFLSGQELTVDIDDVSVEIDLRNLNDKRNKYAVFEIGHTSSVWPSNANTVYGSIKNIEVFDKTVNQDDNPHLIRFGSGLQYGDKLLTTSDITSFGLTDSASLINFDTPELARDSSLVEISNISNTYPWLPPTPPPATIDDDYDGIPNHIEETNELNPLNGTDAALDFDGDGLSNLAEYLNGTDIRVDSTAPQLSVPPDLVVDAVGTLTAVDLGPASANDSLDGEVTIMPDRKNLFLPGTHTVTWTASDNADNTAAGTQIVSVNPLISIGPDQLVSEGSTVRVPVILNGTAPYYPVTISYSVGGSATIGKDHNLQNGSIAIESGTDGYIEFFINEDSVEDEMAESIIVSIESVTNAQISDKSSSTATITDENISPNVKITIEQNSITTRQISKIDGLVTVTAHISDQNHKDSHNYDWSLTDNNLIELDGNNSDDSLIFDPSELPVGIYSIKMNTSDTGIPVANITTNIFIRVVETNTALSEFKDTDGDGYSDLNEGYEDIDNDGLPDFRDRHAKHIIPANSQFTDHYLVETEAGLTLRLGQTSFASGKGNLIVTQGEIDMYAPALSGIKTNIYSDATDFYDFEVAGLPIAGSSVKVVLPLSLPIPAHPVYSKFMPDTGWQNFTETETDKLHSYRGEAGVCPPAGSLLYESGLTPGNWCVQLSIRDGGPNDADNIPNGVIVDPGGVMTVLSEDNSISLAPPSSNTGTISLWLLTVITSFLVFIRTHKTTSKYSHKDSKY